MKTTLKRLLRRKPKRPDIGVNGCGHYACTGRDRCLARGPIDRCF